MYEIKAPIFKGDVLVCEDNPTSQRIIREHLAKIGLDAVIVPNGKAGVEIVRARMQNGNPFGIILMDINMPEMDGLQTAKELIGIGNKTPIIATEALAHDLEAYKSYGILDCIAKPFKTEELRNCLHKYLIPAEKQKSSVINSELGVEMYDSNEELYALVLRSFVKNNRTLLSELNEAIAAGDTKLAHIKVHSLKSAASMIGASGLADAAFNMEHSLLAGDFIFSEQMRLLINEFHAVFNELQNIEEEENDTEWKFTS